ncbi:unnamed protein product [Leptidea sinapis]|uniref:Uncharacterized protein n=1 Tax=Leptidea sinapis TaxID=189913 RepID=A0A5E4R331_9NEOP|nr:unnamed protein product [Leptidea sinapis]
MADIYKKSTDIEQQRDYLQKLLDKMDQDSNLFDSTLQRCSILESELGNARRNILALEAQNEEYQSSRRQSLFDELVDTANTSK